MLSEIKLRSPKEGDLLGGRDPAALARIMGGCPIAGLSVVTAPGDFGGDRKLIGLARAAVEVPVLAKDFHREAGDLEATAAAGADAALLTVCLLDDARLVALRDVARRLGLEVLIETRSADDLARVAETDREQQVVPRQLGAFVRSV